MPGRDSSLFPLPQYHCMYALLTKINKQKTHKEGEKLNLNMSLYDMTYVHADPLN